MRVLVVGSFIVDLVARTERAPEAGESVRGLSFNRYPGGKGANQAVAAKRLGADVIMAGCVGNDDFGRDFFGIFKEEGIPTDYIKKSDKSSTGCSLVTVETSGQNRICMVPGANLDYTVEDLTALEEVIVSSEIVVTQCEMRPEIVDELAKLCAKHSKKFVLNPAPARSLSDETLKAVYILTPNETELAAIVGRELESDEDYASAGKELLLKGVKNVVVTLGSKGSMLINGDGVTKIPSVKVKAVDTVGAGDSFTGALSATLAAGKDLITALKTATATAAVSVQRNGAIPSMPNLNEVTALLLSNK